MDKIVNNWILESFIALNEDLENDKFVKSLKRQIGNAISDKLKTDSNLQNKADELGFNTDFDSTEYIDKKQDVFKNLHVNKSIVDEVKQVLAILRQITNSRGINDFARLKRMCDNGQTNGMTYNKILRIKDFIDSQDLRYLYDTSIDPRGKSVYKFGIKVDKDGVIDDSELDFDNITKDHFDQWYEDKRKKKFTQDEAYLEMRRHIVEKYLESEYGVEFKSPNFALGNEKVKGALMINFTSAFRCPAWNECLVKHACYARAGEGYHDNVKTSNDKKHLMWEASHDDPKLMHMIHNLLKAYVVDYNKVSLSLSQGLKLAKQNGYIDFVKQLGNKDKINNLLNMNFTDMPQDMLNIIKENVRVKDIRLNENGDFIGQWLLDAFDKIAEDFRYIDVNTAAYSCRNLNFKGIKNIIINASRIEMEGPTIARYFYAVPTKMYDAFKDTYKDKNISDEFNAIGRIAEPLFSIDASGNKTPNGNYYYKCPCSRKDFSINGGKLTKVNCYQCHLCYEQPNKAINDLLKASGGKYIIFVKAHGTKANELNSAREMEIVNKIGVPQDYQLGQEDSGEGYSNELEVQEESIAYPMGDQLPLMENEAYEVITDNAISSMNEHLGNIATTENNIAEEKKKFNENYNRFFGNKLND